MSSTQAKFNLKDYLKQRAADVDRALEEYLPASEAYLGRVGESMRYSVFPGGKRFRPVLCLAACEALGFTYAQTKNRAMAPACAFELVHCFSLVHDDLPCMDNDDERRGRPTNHIAFGEDVALLAGDGLSIWAFYVATCLPSEVPAQVQGEVVRELALASGHRGMVGGQVIDLAGQRAGKVDRAGLAQIHACKTGALIKGAVRAGALVGQATPDQLRRLSEYGERVGLVFQITDDILDAGTDPEPISFPAVYGMDESKKMAQQAVEESLDFLAPFGPPAEPLRQLATYLLTRET
jgi:geranylgeranyl diphosphate synthase type II